jgi:tRNA threonylcarbamoyladenosine biosynthesis protein TsaB
MRILAIETATQQVGCAFAIDGEVVARHEVIGARRHAEQLVPAIAFLANQTGIELRSLSAIAVDVGPGLFTGMRVGIATAKAIGSALNLPLVPICSLDVLAHPLRGQSRTIATVIDARRGEVYMALHTPQGNRCRRVTEPIVCSPDDLVAELLAADDLVITGDGAAVYADRLRADVPRAEFSGAIAHPSAADLAMLAAHRTPSESRVPADRVTPMYLRRPDAEINWQMREGAGR